MRKALLVTAALGPLALAPLLSAGAQAAPNLVQNGGFEMNTLPATLNPPDASGAEIDSNWNYTGDLTGWFTTGTSTYNILFFGNVAAASSINADTRFTASEAQHLNSNFDSLSPNGGNFMGLDGDPVANGPLDQTIGGLTVGDKYELTFFWAGTELSNRTGFGTIQLTGSLGGDPFATTPYPNSKPAGTPGSFTREFYIHRQFDERIAVVPGGRDAFGQSAAIRPSGWRVAHRSAGAVDLGDDARRFRRSRLCRLSPPPDGCSHRLSGQRLSLAAGAD